MKSFGRLLMAAALIVPLGVGVAAQSAQATQGNGGKFSCTGTAGTVAIRPGLLLNKTLDQRITGASTGVTCTGGSVTGGNLTFNLQKVNLRCPKLAGGKPVNGTLRVIWNKADKAGQTLLTVSYKVTGTSAHTTDLAITGSVRMGAIAVGKAITGTLSLDKGLKSIPNGGDCATLKPLTGANITAIAFATS